MSTIAPPQAVNVHEGWVSTQLRPGRAINKDVASGPYDTLESFTAALKSIITQDLKAIQPSCTTCELRISTNATIPLVRPNLGPYSEGGDQDLPARFKSSTHDGVGSTAGHHPYANFGDILDISDDRERQIVQRAASRGIIQTIEGIDGYKYSFNNTWAAKEGQALRFSYICQDSMQNRDRHANATPRMARPIDGMREGARKPTYDCRGSVSMKFSHMHQRVVVIYRHYLVHSGVADRGKPMLLLTPQPQANGHINEHASNTQASVSSQPPSIFTSTPTPSRSLKRKRDANSVQRPSNPPGPMSLADLLRRSSGANEKRPLDGRNEQASSSSSTAVAYETPAWQQSAKGSPQRWTSNTVPSPSQPYQGPYTPGQNRGTAPFWGNQIPNTQPIPNEEPARKETSPPKRATPKAQGLFTTMKPVRPNMAPDKYSKSWVLPGPTTSQTTMVNISNQQPQNLPSATTDSKAPTLHSPILSFAEWSSRNLVVSAPLPEAMPLSDWSQQPAGQRHESPDPWFPKREG